MSIYKDWLKGVSGTTLSYKVKSFFDIKWWLKLHKFRKQRADRGWSDRDAWDGGNFIVEITASILQELNKECTDEWVKLNIKRSNSYHNYKNLQLVIDDIRNFISFDNTSWAEGLVKGTDDNFAYFKKDTDKKLTKKQINLYIERYRKKHKKLHEKAIRAMVFFSNNFSKFWY